MVNVDYAGYDLTTPAMPLPGIFESAFECALACVGHAPRCTHYTLTAWNQCYLKENAEHGKVASTGSTAGACPRPPPRNNVAATAAAATASAATPTKTGSAAVLAALDRSQRRGFVHNELGRPDTADDVSSDSIVSKDSVPDLGSSLDRSSDLDEVVVVRFETTKGAMQFESHRSWAPVGVAQFLKMVRSGFFNTGGGVAMFRCVPRFVIQFGLHGDPDVTRRWGEHRLQDDKARTWE